METLIFRKNSFTVSFVVTRRIHLRITTQGTLLSWRAVQGGFCVLEFLKHTVILLKSTVKRPLSKIPKIESVQDFAMVSFIITKRAMF